jgi:hypothetical protein
MREAASVSRGGGPRRTNMAQNSYGDLRAHTEDCKYIVIKVCAGFSLISLNTCLATSLTFKTADCCLLHLPSYHSMPRMVWNIAKQLCFHIACVRIFLKMGVI